MVVLSKPGTYGTRKCSSWCDDILKSTDPEYKHPEIQYSKNPKISKFKNTKKSKQIARYRRCKKCWTFGFLDFLIFWVLDFCFFFCVLYLCFQSVETAPKLDSEKNGVCSSIYSAFKRCACRRGGDHIYIYMYRDIHIYIYNG